MYLGTAAEGVMAQQTGIEWTHSTWSPSRVRVKANAAQIAREKGYTSLVTIAEKMAGRVGQHCEHVSPGCEHCYAETNNHRCLPGNGTGLPYDRRSRDLVEAFVDGKVLLQPLSWVPIVDHVEGCAFIARFVKGRRHGLCKCPTRPRRIFVENQSDLFGEWVTDEMLDRIFAVMVLCPQHTFQVLTKRPERMLAYLQQVNDERNMRRWINAALEIKPEPGFVAREHFIWPLPNFWLGVSVENQAAADARSASVRKLADMGWLTYVSSEPRLGPIDWTGWEFIKWLITGGESGYGARPMHPAWPRSDREWCKAHKIAFFFKQWGEYKNGSDPVSDLVLMQRVGKKAAGSLLDGVEHKAFPEARG
jgi:protein gp37